MSGKVKIKELRKVVGDVNINGMFEEMMGVKDAELDIIIPKFVFVRNALRHIYRVFLQFHDILIKDFPMFADGLADIKKYAEEFKESTYLKHEHEEKEAAYEGVSKEDMNNLYRKLKENQHVKSLIVLCSKLNRYHNCFSDTKALKINFVNQEPGLTFNLFDFSSLDFKALWANENMKDSVKRYVLVVMSSLHKHTHALYRCVTSPDVDVDKFTEALMNAIGELKKQPKLHRCNGAFRRIEQSVELLKEKFSDYYRESVASENPDMLVMNFIVDVSNQGGANASLTREFRTIIQYMHEVSQKSGKSKDPNVQKIFKMLNNNFSLMEKKTGVKPIPLDEKPQQDATLDTTKPVDDQPSAAEIADEKQSKRIEKQKAKKLAKKKKKKTDAIGEASTDETAETVATNENIQSTTLDDHTLIPKTIVTASNETINNVTTNENN